MSFIPLIAETAGAVGSFVGEETGSSVLGAIAASEVGKKAGQAIESGARTAVDSLFGTGTFENLERSIGETYSSGKTLAEDIYNIRDQVESGEFGQDQLSKLKSDREKFNKTAVIQGLSEFSKDFSSLVSTGEYDALGMGSAGIVNNNSVISNVLSTLARVNPFYSYLASKFGDKLADFVAPTNEEYLKVASVYNGVGLYEQDMVLEDLGGSYEFSIINEIGERVVWKYPEYNNYTVIKPIWGTWTGLNSPNNSICLSGTVDGRGVQSFLDKIAFLHDCSYRDLGSFNEFGDYQLISRGIYGKQNGLFIFPGELAVANVAISYFSTLGKVMRKMFAGNSVKNEEPLIKEVLSETVGITEVTNEEIQQIKEDTATVIKTIPTSYGSATVGNSNFALRSALDNLEIQLN